MQIRNYLPVFLLLMTLVFIGVWNKLVIPEHDNALSPTETVCLDGDACLNKARLQIAFSPDPVVVEAEIRVKLYLSDGWNLKKAWVEGVNMYMGKSPLIIEDIHHQNKEITAIMFLGSCSEPKMHWRITTEWQADKDALGLSANQTVISTYDFFTNR
ncbi:hypothetical protein KIH87_10105 [Paraneptunicella aestuarii]|uniref:hypothetical protein n=1 Tax=Paraneptunicella aestuarii TaxID=2831148 RepID=UPI001E307211|nr:hypothetical protein [Paraneptunicella aestuarii]UAA37105.1 hypothetical protein KIH87_10105 [Paraneptunicella aestuarii]